MHRPRELAGSSADDVGFLVDRALDTLRRLIRLAEEDGPRGALGYLAARGMLYAIASAIAVGRVKVR